MSTSIDGLVSSLNTTQLITSLMSVEKQPQVLLQNAQSLDQTRIASFQSVNTKVAALQTAAQALETSTGWDAYQVATSNNLVAIATASTGATPGTISFTVDRLASANALISSGSVPSTASTVTSGNLLLARNTGALGFSSVAAGNGLALGAHTVTVTQSSTAASRAATTALAGSTTVTTGVNDTLDVTVGGVAQTITLAAGTYSRAALATAITGAAGGALTASVDSGSLLHLTTTHEGGAASLQVTGGTALADLGLGPDATAATGTDGVVTVDGTSTTLHDLYAGGTASLAAPSGTVEVVLGGGLRTGTLTATDVSTGDGSLGAVVNAVNAAGAGLTAAAVQTTPGAYRLSLRSSTTGAASAIGIAAGAFSAVGTLQTLDAAQDAQVTVGTGPAAYQLTSATNTVSTLLPGTTIHLAGTSASPVTLSVNRDSGALAKKVQALVDAANAVHTEIVNQTAYDTAKSTASPLTGNFTVRVLSDALGRAMTGAVTGSTLVSPGLAGVTIAKDGSFVFDSAKFTDAYETHAAAVKALFVQGGSTTDPRVSFVSGTARTTAGSYAVSVTRAAEQATATGTGLAGGTITDAETIDLSMGSTSISYTAAAGSSLASIADGLNTALATNHVRLLATVKDGALTVTSQDYGSATKFRVRTSASGAGQTGIVDTAGTWRTGVGVDVAGSINGVTATGIGRVLQAPVQDTTLGGIGLLVTASAADVAGTHDFGTVSYAPGVAARLSRLGKMATDPINGSITLAVNNLQADSTRLDARISDWDTRLAQRQALLKSQFTAMETALSNLKSQSTALTNALNSLTNTNSSSNSSG